MSEAAKKIDAIDARHETSTLHAGETLRTYWLIFYWLMGLLVATVVAAQINLDALIPGLNLMVAMFIATVKGLLVVLFFMHVKQSSKLTWIFASAAFIWLGILIFLSFNDYLFRDHIQPTQRQTTAEVRSPSPEHTGADIAAPVAPKAD